MSVLLLILQLTGVGPMPDAGRPCGDECRAVLRAATQWARSVSVERRGASPGRLLLDVDPPTSANVPDRAIERRRQLLASVANDSGLEVVRRTTHPSWRACENAPHSAACSDALGTGYIALEGPRFLSDDEALVHADVVVLKRSSVGWSTMSCQLRLQRGDDGVWSVHEERVCVVS